MSQGQVKPRSQMVAGGHYDLKFYEDRIEALTRSPSEPASPGAHRVVTSGGPGYFEGTGPTKVSFIIQKLDARGPGDEQPVKKPGKKAKN